MRNYADERELTNMVNELLGIQHNIAKANRTDRKVQNRANLVKRMKNGSYRPNPTRRVYIPKETKGKMRPLGISCYEDKLVENAIAQILEQIYEPKFYNESFGFRPCRPVGKGNGWYYYDEDSDEYVPW